MAKPLTVPPLSDSQVPDLRQLSDTTTKAKLRRRYQIVVLAHQGRSVAAIATLVFRSRDTVERVLKRSLSGGVAALPPRKAPGMAPTVTPAWKAELLRVIGLDPPTVGVPSAPGTTGLLATYLATTPGIAVTAATVRLYLHAADYVCKRPTWPLNRQAEEPPGSGGNACGWR
jgi:transposase